MTAGSRGAEIGVSGGVWGRRTYVNVAAILALMIVLIDNYDSFTYNLVQRIGELDPSRPMKVLRNDKTSIAEIESLKPSHIIISPGPCSPREAGISNEVLMHFGPKLPTF